MGDMRNKGCQPISAVIGEVTIWTDMVGVRDDELQVMCGFVHGPLRFKGRGGDGIRRNHAAYRRVHGVYAPSPTLLAGQSEYNVAVFIES